MWDVGDAKYWGSGFWGCGVLELWDVEDLRFCGCGMFGM